MLGFAPTGQFALGQVSQGQSFIAPSIVGVAGTGAVGAILASIVGTDATGRIPGVSGTGSAGIVLASTLNINPERLLANVTRRLRKLGFNVANTTR